MIIQGFKKLFNKGDFDFEAAEIELFDFHPQIRVVLAINGIFFNNRESKLRFVWPFVCVGLAVVGSVFEVMIILHSLAVNELSQATECFAYAVVVIVVLILYPCTLLGRHKIYELIDEMNNDFKFLCSLEPRYRDAFLAGQLTIWQKGLMWLCFIMLLMLLYCSMTALELLYMSLFATLDEHSVRPLIFPIWLPEDDPYRTPNYEIFMLMEYIIICTVVSSFGVYVYILFHFLLHNLIQMNMIICAVDCLFEGLDQNVTSLECGDVRRQVVQATLRKRFRRIASWHNGVFRSVNKILKIYGPTLVYQVMFSSLEICLLSYQVADQLDRGKFDILFTLLTFGCCVQLWIPCFLGTMLQNKGFSVGDACWHNDWHETPLARLVVRDLCIIMMRSQRPIVLQFTGIPPLNLETFSSIMSTAYSYFNMLRQVNQEM